MIWLDNSRILAIFAVIFLHVSSSVIAQSDVGSGYWWIANIYDSAVRWCVPVFVMISGALLLDQNKNEGLAAFYTKRLSRVLIPILFWSFVFLLLKFLKGYVKGAPPSGSELLNLFLSGTPYYHMWFLYMILGLYLFTPFFKKIVAHSTTQELKFLVTLMFVFATVNSLHEGLAPESKSGLFINWFLEFIPYFFMGHIARHSLLKPSRTLLILVWTGSMIGTALGSYAINTINGADAYPYFYSYLSITVIPMSISILYLFKYWVVPMFSETLTKKIASLILGVYLIHPIILEGLNSSHLGATTFNPVVSVPLWTLFIFIASLISAWLINQLPFIKRTI